MVHLVFNSIRNTLHIPQNNVNNYVVILSTYVKKMFPINWNNKWTRALEISRQKQRMPSTIHSANRHKSKSFLFIGIHSNNCSIENIVIPICAHENIPSNFQPAKIKCDIEVI